MRGNHGGDVDTFAQEAMNLWIPFLTSVIEAPIAWAQDEDRNKGLVTLKIQAIRVCIANSQEIRGY